jgi:hypothetical protein
MTGQHNAITAVVFAAVRADFLAVPCGSMIFELDAATDRSGLLWDEHHSAAGGLLPRPDVLDLAQGLPLGLQVQLAAGDHFE